MSVDQGAWAYYVGPAKFSYNAATHLAITQSPFKVAYEVDFLQAADNGLY